MAKIIGIDLGTTNSCVTVVADRKPDVITNPKFAPAVGLLFYGAEKENEEATVRFTSAPSSAAESSLFHGVWERMKRWFGDIR